jgi:hypothetical protein
METKPLIHQIEKAGLFAFIDDARKSGGRIFLYTNISIAVAYLMYSEFLSYSEAYLQVDRACPHSTPEPKYLQELHDYDNHKAGELAKDALYFQCICGSCCLTLLTPFSAKFTPCKCPVWELSFYFGRKGC